jgi:hypothetical protein
MSKFSDLLGTLGGYFKIGLTGVRLKNSSGNLLVRNSADSADANITAAKLLNTGNTIDIGTTNVLSVSKNTAQSGGLTIIYPAAKATDGQILAQKAGTAAGVIEFEFVSAGSNSQCLTTDTTSLAFGATSPVAMFTLPANAVVEAVRVIVDTAFTGTPSLSIGITGTTSKYLASTQVDLLTTGIYEVYPGIAASGSSEAVIATYAANTASVGAARIEIDYVVPV